MFRRSAVALTVLVVLLSAREALAQQTTGPFGECKTGLVIRVSAETLFDPNDKEKPIGRLLKGVARNPVTIECDETRIFADEVEWRDGDEVAYFRGNVVLSQSDLNVAAERAEFHRQTRNGTFYNATGTAHLTDRQVDRSLFGTLEPEVAFHAEKLEKTGPRTYRLTNGGFTTCAQPAPRWEMSGSSGSIVLDKRAVLKNAILKVKHVPIFYVPLIYYPLEEDDRSTGFLIPTYTTSSIKGSGLSNAFFWAIDRSQDATFYHDYYSKTGQGIAGEYRFVAAPGSNGQARVYMLDESEQADESGNVVRAAHRTYDVTGHTSVSLPRGFHLYSRTNYVSDITTKQLYQQNIAESSRRDRYIGATLNGNLGRYRLSANVEQRDAFFEEPQEDGTIEFLARRQGRMPQVNLAATEKPIGRSRLYFGLNGEMANLLSAGRSRRSHDGPQPVAVRRVPHAAVPAEQTAVALRDGRRLVAVDALARKHRPRHEGADQPAADAPTAGHTAERHRPGGLPHLPDTRERLCGATQAPHRAERLGAVAFPLRSHRGSRQVRRERL